MYFIVVVVVFEIFAELQKAEQVAAKWKTEEAEQNLRANQVEQKHIDVDNEETLKKLYDICVKVLDNHSNPMTFFCSPTCQVK